MKTVLSVHGKTSNIYCNVDGNICRSIVMLSIFKLLTETYAIQRHKRIHCCVPKAWTVMWPCYNIRVIHCLSCFPLHSLPSLHWSTIFSFSCNTTKKKKTVTHHQSQSAHFASVLVRHPPAWPVNAINEVTYYRKQNAYIFVSYIMHLYLQPITPKE